MTEYVYKLNLPDISSILLDGALSLIDLKILWSGHQESNLDLLLRRQLFYPLNYGQTVI